MPGVRVGPGGQGHLGTGGVAGFLLALHRRVLGVHRQAGARVAGDGGWEGGPDLQSVGRGGVGERR